MIAIFYAEEDSLSLSETIHNFLIKNRDRYSAEKWSNINKSDSEEKWLTKIPSDINNYKEKIDMRSIELINELPSDWENISSVGKAYFIPEDDEEEIQPDPDYK